MPQHFIYREWRPHPALAPYVTTYRLLQSGGPPLGAHLIQVLPTGCVDLFFHFGAVPAPPEPARSYLAGPTRQVFVTSPSQPLDTFGVQFRPGVAHLFLGTAVHQFVHTTVSLHAVLGAAAAELDERLRLSPNLAERVALVEQWLLRAAPPQRAVDTDVLRAVALIEHSHGTIPIEHLLRAVGISRRHLERKFRTAVGLLPKQWAGVQRLRHVVALLHRQPAQHLTRLATHSGFFDQAHLINDFRRHTGMTPRAYLTARKHAAIFQFNTPIP